MPIFGESFRFHESWWISLFSSLVFHSQVHNNKENFFSDPGTYPIIVIMGCAITFMTGMGINALVSYKDVKINPEKRNSKLQTWGQEEQPHKLSYAVHWNSYQKNCPEGMGIDHEEWKKQKEVKTSDSVQSA